MIPSESKKTLGDSRGFGHRARDISDAAGQAELPEVTEAAERRRPLKSARRTERPLRAVGSAARPLPRCVETSLPVTGSITRRAGVAEMVEAVPVVEQEALGRGAVVLEAEARVAQPMIREASWCQTRHGSRSPWVSLLTFVSTTLRAPLDLYTRETIRILTK
jgi:hypothetical protein